MAERKNANQRTSAAAKRRKRARDRQRHFLLLGVGAVVCLVLLISFLLYRDYKSRVYLKSRIEAGDFTISVEDFLKRDVKASFADKAQVDAVNGHVPGDYPLTIHSGLFTYRCTLTVEDTVPPLAAARASSVEYGTSPEAKNFVSDIEDQTEVTATFAVPPDPTKIGRQDVRIALEDLGGNITAVDSWMDVVPVKSLLVMEAGSPVPDKEAFLLESASDLAGMVEMITPSDSINMYAVADQEISFLFGDYSFTSTLRTRDTIPPVVTAAEALTLPSGSQPDPKGFISSANDATSLTYAFEAEPDMTLYGQAQEVAVLVTDAGGNVTRVTSSLTVTLDDQPPVISGVKDIRIYTGDAVSYLDGVTVTDNMDPDVKLDVDTSQVRQKEAGTYPIVYIATDASGNKATVNATLTVVQSAADEETVQKLAKEVIGQIITDDMSGYDKLYAIYYWVRGNIRYQDQPNMEDWLKAAYDGLKYHQGDCYVYCMTARALLDAAGIKNMVIDTAPLRYIHYWNLVDIGEGWYHFDTTPRAAGGTFLYMNDADIQEYSRNHQNSHIYDHDRFPGVQ
jgi:hypothetical protein